MNPCVFKTSEVRRCLNHTLSSAAQQKTYADSSDPASPRLLFVHDQGVYLMSGGAERDEKEPGQQSSYCAYAEGCDPEKDSDWWETARNLVGGDDFVETLEVDESWRALLEQNELMLVQVTPTEISVGFSSYSSSTN